MANHNQAAIKNIGISCIVLLFALQTVLLFKRNSIYKSNVLLWEDTLKKAPGKLRALHNLSHFYLAEKKYEKAFIALHSLANSKASPHYISYAHSNLGALYLQRGEYQKAEAEFKKGIKVQPSRPSNYLNLGTIYASQGRYQKAMDAYVKAESLYKDYKWGDQASPELYLNKARLLFRLGLYKEAENSAARYIKLAPGPGKGHYFLGQLYGAMGKNMDALREYGQSGNDPKLKAQAHNHRAMIFVQQNHFNAAIEELEQAIANDPNMLDAHYNLGNVLIQSNGDSIRARRHLKTALKLTTNLENQKQIKLAMDNLFGNFQGSTVEE